MGLSLRHIDANVDLVAIEKKLQELYDKKREIEEEINELQWTEDNATLSSLNITHNLAPMAEKAGIYDVLWHATENGIEYAEQLIEPLEKGIALLKSDPDTFKQLNSPNGWGSYDGLLNFCRLVLQASKEHPDSKIEVDR